MDVLCARYRQGVLNVLGCGVLKVIPGGMAYLSQACEPERFPMDDFYPWVDRK